MNLYHASISVRQGMLGNDIALFSKQGLPAGLSSFFPGQGVDVLNVFLRKLMNDITIEPGRCMIRIDDKARIRFYQQHGSQGAVLFFPSGPEFSPRQAGNQDPGGEHERNPRKPEEQPGENFILQMKLIFLPGPEEIDQQTGGDQQRDILNDAKNQGRINKHRHF